ncbi:MAG: hypothetical protein JW878_06435 [Methanomicrobia archaeon]|nr:hypothetical protein [Methanomicrobia archaeon]
MADVFISCGFNAEERILGDWCYEYLTSIGVSAFWGGVVASGYPAVDAIQAEIRQSKLVVAFLHRRERLEGNFNWAMPPGVRDELAFASSFQRPVVAFVEKGVKIDGLLSHMAMPRIPFDRSDPSIIGQELPRYIENLQSQAGQGDNNAGTVLLILGLPIFAGLIGYLWGRSEHQGGNE